MRRADVRQMSGKPVVSSFEPVAGQSNACWYVVRTEKRYREETLVEFENVCIISVLSEVCWKKAVVVGAEIAKAKVDATSCARRVRV